MREGNLRRSSLASPKRRCAVKTHLCSSLLPSPDAQSCTLTSLTMASTPGMTRATTLHIRASSRDFTVPPITNLPSRQVQVNPSTFTTRSIEAWTRWQISLLFSFEAIKRLHSFKTLGLFGSCDRNAFIRSHHVFTTLCPQDSYRTMRDRSPVTVQNELRFL